MDKSEKKALVDLIKAYIELMALIIEEDALDSRISAGIVAGEMNLILLREWLREPDKGWFPFAYRAISEKMLREEKLEDRKEGLDTMFRFLLNVVLHAYPVTMNDESGSEEPEDIKQLLN